MSLNQLSALEVAAHVRAGELSAREVLEASLSQIRAVDGQPGRLDKQQLEATLLQEGARLPEFACTLHDGLGLQGGLQLDADNAPGIERAQRRTAWPGARLPPQRVIRMRSARSR